MLFGIDMVAGELPQPLGTSWLLRGITSNERYVTRDEKGELLAKQQSLGRPESTCAALIPLRKTAEWWANGYSVGTRSHITCVAVGYRALCPMCL